MTRVVVKCQQLIYHMHDAHPFVVKTAESMCHVYKSPPYFMKKPRRSYQCLLDV